ncbi:hypothetical protein CC1G_10932 [Coprinopsis cinerea okayama7|uniref:C2H2-type domain-containing protein n=1 Tax=Coprinopsis cinerea (strain Okayama-7 / 130 / ATCC MYA-4618 / FGSC 9003) TaxID=240176 RepID=A8NT39_COPC7|nr:hypothetical protein CC1G_10932 [Coprinopsis cinerea okayama7\|eukprot:XP_001836151.1 hypothetical protein CC1G_10932 [Coprinopsis cinerea okayama7\
MAPEENLHITVLGPDDQSSAPVEYKLNTATTSFPSPIGSPDPSSQDSSSGGYPSPDTPLDRLDVSFFDTSYSQVDEYHDGLSVMTGPVLTSPYSPTSLSPCLGGLSLGDSSNDTSGPYGGYDDRNLGLGTNNDFPVPDFHSLVTPELRSSSPSRASLSPLIIPQTYPSHSPSTADWSQQQQQQQQQQQSTYDNDDFLSQILLGQSPFPESLNVPATEYQLPVDSLADETALQRLPRSPSMQHARSTSEVNTPWTGSSGYSTSPSLMLTPSEPSSSAASLTVPDPYNNFGGPGDDLVLAQSTNLYRSHSDSATRGRRFSHVGPDRGRTQYRSPPSSTNSSRRSSPYPLPAASPVSPNQVYEADNHLAPPPIHVQGMEGLRRRHSFNGYGRPPPMVATANPNEIIVPVGYLPEPITPTSRKVASQAGIKASARRRTKEAKFSCTLCSQTFTTNHNLKNHMNVHLGVKEHECPDCNRAFTTQSVLARHTKTCKLNPDNVNHRRQQSQS